MPKKVIPNGHEPFMSPQAARDFLIKEAEKDPTKESVVDKVTVHCNTAKRLMYHIPQTSINYDHVPQSEFLRFSGKDSKGNLHKCGISNASC
ncbi:MAG TPA: hypothetical protein VIH31_02205 [Candidatus Paceibacterota bacterium]